MFKFAHRLPANVELVPVLWGQSNMRPWGHRNVEGYAAAPHLALPEKGKDLTILSLTACDANGVAGGNHGAIGTYSLVSCAETVSSTSLPSYVDATLRLCQADYGESLFSHRQKGVARVVRMVNATTMLAQWTVAFQADDPNPVLNLAGYVKLARAPAYDNVRVLHAYLPERPGDYPSTTTPAVPGFSVPSSITSFADVGLFLRWEWNEGIDGPGLVLNGTISGLVFTRSSGDTVDGADADVFVNAIIRISTATGGVVCKGTVTVHGTGAAATFTVGAWTGTVPSGTVTAEITVPHWRDNENEVGFRYPSNDHQPGGWLPHGSAYYAANPTAPLSEGQVYSRAAQRFVPGYVGRLQVPHAVDTSICSTGIGQRIATGAASMVASLVGGKLRIDCDATFNTTGLTAFTKFLRKNTLVRLTNWATQNINYVWRVDTLDAAGEFVDLIAVSTAEGGIPGGMPGAITATCVAGTTLTRNVYERQHRFGAALPFLWKLSNLLGRRVNAILFGINSASLCKANEANPAGYGGQIGWWNSQRFLDFTPSNPDGLAARLKRMITVTAPAALSAEGNQNPMRIPCNWGLQGEGDAIKTIGRESYKHTLPGFYSWLREVQAPYSLYGGTVKIPCVHGLITKSPWSSAQLPNADLDGLVRAGTTEFAVRDGAAATVETDDAAKLSGSTFFGIDIIHHNATGENQNGTRSADAAVPLINAAFAQCTDPGAVDVVNRALLHIGATSTVKSLDPPDNSAVAIAAAKAYQPALDRLLERRQWKFAQRRATLVALTNTSTVWGYTYALPADCLKALKILPAGFSDDLPYGTQTQLYADPLLRSRTTQPGLFPILFRVEPDTDGVMVLRTNEQNADLGYTARVRAIADMSPTFLDALSWEIAADLASSVVKGDVGVRIQRMCLAEVEARLGEAATHDATQGRVHVDAAPPWITWR